MIIHFIQHETFEGPGAYLNWARERNFKITFSKVFEGQMMPSPDAFDMLIVMGGPQSPSTTKEECPYFDSKAEQALIKQAIDSGKAVIGVCLGSQLVGNALGANYDHSPEKEIGVFPLHLTEAGLKDKNISHFGKQLLVGHWHNDMPGLTGECVVLATSDGCPRQIIRYSRLAYGIQCHMELTPEIVKSLIAAEKNLQKYSTKFKFVQSAEEILSFDYKEMNRMLYGFLDNLAEEYKSVKSLKAL